MKVWRKFTAVALALVMMLAMSVSALAATETGAASLAGKGGKVGAYVVDNEGAGKDTPTLRQSTSNKIVTLVKAITAINPETCVVYGPEITYTYAIEAASGGELQNITDDGTLHESGAAVTKAAEAGTTPNNVTLTSTTVSTSTTGSVTLEWATTDILAASPTPGTQNNKAVTFDFSGIVFPNPGVYRYKITETATYDNTGVTNGNSHTRFLDVYVMRNDSYDSTNVTANSWDIYGYVCTDAATADITTSTENKTDGFIGDTYSTYNLTVGKTLTGDNGMIAHKFPFEVNFSSSVTIYNLFATVNDNSALNRGNSSEATDYTTGGTALDGTSTAPTNNVYTVGMTDGNPEIANSGSVKYTGIPFGTTFTVKETNDVAGTTYAAKAQETVGSTAAVDVAFDNNASTGSTGSVSTDKKTVSIDYNTTALTETITAPDNTTTVQFTNALALISPTGVTLRYAPYLAMLGVGIVALPLSIRRRKEDF